MDRKKLVKLLSKGKIDFHSVSELIEKEKKQYVKEKVIEYEKKGFSRDEAINRANQSWRTYIGNHLQNLLFEILSSYFSSRYENIRVIKDTALKGKNLSRELDLVKRMLLIHYGNYSFLPDADIILYRKDGGRVSILCIVSVKNSFRERGFETTYWKLKLSENVNTSHIKVFLATPDKDNEISYIKSKTGIRKMRVILEYELDGIYMLKKDFEKNQKIKEFEKIFEDIEKLIKEKSNDYVQKRRG